jgi:hypothetical protein
MNTSATGPASAPPAPREHALERRGNAGDGHRARDFERLLREKASKHDEDDDTLLDAAGLGAGPAVPTFITPAAPPPLKRSGGEGEAGSAGLDAGGGGAARAAMQASLSAPPDSPQALAPTANAAGAWELTLRQPLGAAMDVRATRNDQAVNGWSLAIGSPTVDAAVLARHAPRLNERLKARSLSNSHVRIEESGREEQQP